MKANRNPIAVTNKEARKKGLGKYAASVVTAMTGNANFPNAATLLAALTAAIAVLAKAEEAVLTKAVGTVGQRDLARAQVVAALNHVVDHVQGVVEQQTTPDNGVAIILSAFMSVMKVKGQLPKPPLAVTQGRVSGAAALAAKAVRKAVSYYWQFSLDQKSWSNAPEGTRASTTIGGLTVGQVYYFRFRTLSKNGLSDFSQVVSLMVQ